MEQTGFTVGDMLRMQAALQDKYHAVWAPMQPETAPHQLLWMVGEIGEVIDIVKKHGSRETTQDPALRQHFMEEMADVLMYFGDVMLCMGVSEQELKDAYTRKFERNMNRWNTK